MGLYGVGGGYLCAMMWWERIWGVRAASFGGGGGVGGLLRSGRREGEFLGSDLCGATQGMVMLSRLNVGVTRSSTCLLQRV